MLVYCWANKIDVRTILNIHCGVPGVFASGDDALSPVVVITGCDDVLVALPILPVSNRGLSLEICLVE